MPSTAIPISSTTNDDTRDASSTVSRDATSTDRHATSVKHDIVFITDSVDATNAAVGGESDTRINESLVLTIPSIEIDHRALATYVESPSFDDANAVWLEDPVVCDEAVITATRSTQHDLSSMDAMCSSATFDAFAFSDASGVVTPFRILVDTVIDTDASCCGKDSNDSNDSSGFSAPGHDKSTSSKINNLDAAESETKTIVVDSNSHEIKTCSSNDVNSLIASSFDALDRPAMALPSLPSSTQLPLQKMSFQALLLESDETTTLESHDIDTMLAPIHLRHDSESSNAYQADTLPLNLSDPGHRCSYRKGKCQLPRTYKRNGALHTYCVFHRWRSIENQKAFDAKRRKMNAQSSRERSRQSDANAKASAT